jgi:FkbM family methyltransferase
MPTAGRGWKRSLIQAAKARRNITTTWGQSVSVKESVALVRSRIKVGGLDLDVTDPHERTTQYIYDEIFEGRTYAHPNVKVPANATIIDVGANIGLFAIWAAREWKPKTILAYEASPSTHEVLVENVNRHINAGKTGITATPINLAVSREAGRELTLHQPPYVAGLSTILDGKTLPWIDELRAKNEIYIHKVQSTTISHEIATRKLASVDLLKIDVEGHFMEVLEGIQPADFARVRSIILEAEYVETLGHTREQLTSMLQQRGYTVEAQDAAQVMLYAWRA